MLKGDIGSERGVADARIISVDARGADGTIVTLEKAQHAYHLMLDDKGLTRI
jgi:hypothetical protein